MSSAKPQQNAEQHEFHAAPSKTLVLLSIPVLCSLIAEPLTGLVDTAMVKELGPIALAALGIGTTVLSLAFWVFNFLSISTQTDVSQSFGNEDSNKSTHTNALAMTVAFGIGLLVIVVGWFVAPIAVSLAGAQGAVLEPSLHYVRVRLFGAPALLVTMVAFGALRGLQNMTQPMVVAVSTNVLNILLDWLLIFGVGPFPEMGITGAALASVIAQWLGAAWAVYVVLSKLGWPRKLVLSRASALFRVGGDLFIRTGMLILFLFWATRVANLMSANAGAAHQAIRQMWIFSAFVLEAFAATTQSLVGFFLGAGDRSAMRRVVKYALVWSIGSGVVMSFVLWLGTGVVQELLVPEEAIPVFGLAWLAVVWSQPLNSLAFITDGVHWGTSDYPYMRNGMLLASFVGIVLLVWLETSGSSELMWVWGITAAWIIVRGTWGMVRIWPGVGRSPFKE